VHLGMRAKGVVDSLSSGISLDLWIYSSASSPPLRLRRAVVRSLPRLNCNLFSTYQRIISTVLRVYLASIFHHLHLVSNHMS